MAPSPQNLCRRETVLGFRRLQPLFPRPPSSFARTSHTRRLVRLLKAYAQSALSQPNEVLHEFAGTSPELRALGAHGLSSRLQCLLDSFWHIRLRRDVQQPLIS